ncbi:MAG: glycosyltransferase family 2 protein [bacterium]|nr:glycosyltransferase family 2 protein [bacterium]
MEEKNAVAVVLANWNGAACIGRCLEMVFNQRHAPAEVVVVDNGSTDGSPEFIRTQFPQVHLIERSHNEGIPRAWNLGIEQTRSFFVLILNTDVFLDRDFLYEAVQAIQTAPETGSVAARIYKADTDRIDNVGLFLQRRIRSVNSTNVTEPEYVFAPSGAAMFCRRDMLEDVSVFGQYFDESYFANWEDMDLAWRAQLRGWRCLYTPSAIAHHVGSASQGEKVRVVDKPAFFQRRLWTNRYLTICKNASPGVLLALLPWLLLAEKLSWIYILFRIPWRLHVFFLAHVDFLRCLPDALRKRRWIQRNRVVGAREMLKFFKGF